MAATPAPQTLPIAHPSPAGANPKPSHRPSRLTALREALPQGRTLPAEEVRKRHEVLLGILWIHALLLPLYALTKGLGATHALWEGALIGAPAAMATLARDRARMASLLVALGLMTSSAVLVHLAGGVIEAHFHFFVIIVLLTLYEDWLVLLLAVGYVLAHHGVMGVLDPEAVYNHSGAIDHPWQWAAVHATFVAAAAGGAIAAWRLNEDVRERALRAEAEAARSARELARSNRDLQDFASVASHDLREPLLTVTGFVDLLERRYGAELPADGQDFLRHTREGTARMRELIEGLLAYARAGSSELDVAPVDLERIVSDVLADLEAATARTGAVVEVGPLPTVPGDARLLRQVLQNLVANALKFHGDAAPRVDITAAAEPGAVAVTVADRGIGIDPERAAHIFDMFGRAHGPQGYEGAGIGLAVCARIVERHGGTIAVAPRPGGGTTFTVTLPAA